MIGIGSGILLASLGAVMGYFDYMPGKGTNWGFLVFAALPFAAWGVSHLARQRGYPSGAGYGLFAVGFLGANFIPGVSAPVTVGFIFLFVVLFPTIILLALPKKSSHLHRR